MVRFSTQQLRDEVCLAEENDRLPPSGPDWRGWIALAWASLWGIAYALMVIQARAPQFLRWVETFTATTRSS